MKLTLAWWPRLGRNRTGSRTAPKPQLTDEQWDLIADLFPDRPMTRRGGRPRIRNRRCLEGVLWMLRSGARWQDLPERFPSPSTCWRRHRDWTLSGAFQQAWARLLGKLDGLKHVNWEEALGDGTFCPAKKGGAAVGRTKRGKGTKIMLLTDGVGTPLGAAIAPASTAEVQLIEPLLDGRTSRRRPPRLIYDKAADSDALRGRLARRRIDLICPHRSNRVRPKTQDGRKLRRYKRRYQIERSISWLFNCRRLVVRYEYWDSMFLGFVQLACLYTILQRF